MISNVNLMLHRNVHPDNIQAMKIKTIIHLLGGPVLVGKRLGIRSQAISVWSSREKIPAQRVPELVEIANERGLNITAHDMRPDINWAALWARE